MQIRFGYVAIALNLAPITSSSPVTFKTYSRILSPDERLNKLKKTTLSNLEDLEKILNYNIEHDIHFYRITSALIPLATHPQVNNWNYRQIFRDRMEAIGRLAIENNLRLDTHPDQFNVLNSLDEQVISNTIRNLRHHLELFTDMQYPDGRMVIHLGSGQGGKDKALERFVRQAAQLPDELRERLMLENDDKIFTAADVLKACYHLYIPMVFDLHHHHCNNSGEELDRMIEAAFATWSNTHLPPKIHISSPRDGPYDRKHADYIEVGDFIAFVERCIPLGIDFDVMVEAKMKDLALFRLIEDIKEKRPEWQWIDKTTLKL